MNQVEVRRFISRLMAKTDRNGEHIWLPLTVHLEDVWQVSMRLWDYWLADSIRERLADACGGEDEARRFLGLVALLHDIGKGTPDFQLKLYKALYHINSDVADEYSDLLRLVSDVQIRNVIINSHKNHALMSLIVAQNHGINAALASILGAHHGKPANHEEINDDSSMSENIVGHKIDCWSSAHSWLIGWALEKTGFADVAQIPAPDQAAQVLFAGLLIIADWVASNERLFPYIPMDKSDEYVDSTARADAAWAKLHLPEPWHSEADALEDVSMLFDIQKFGFDEPNSMQTELIETVEGMRAPGLIVVEAPMGSGKTEAALALSEILAAKRACSGLFFALPTQATSNGIFPRILRWSDAVSRGDGQKHSIRLVHGSAYLNSDFTGLFGEEAQIDEEGEQNGKIRAVTAMEFFNGSKKALLADFVIGTVDQLLMAALCRKHVMLRHIGLASKVVIIDECHAYDSYMNVYLDRALEWLSAYNVPVIVLSATLPAVRRVELIRAYGGKRMAIPDEIRDSRAYPLMTYIDGNTVGIKTLQWDTPSNKVSVRPLSDDELISTIDECLSDGGCLGIVVNTVRRAQELADNLRNRYPNDDVRLIHARFLMGDRIKKEKSLLASIGKNAENRPQRCIVIGTQVIEQSLDIDFDLMISELCPMDLLLQRIGRLHRHPGRIRPEKLAEACCYVLGLNEELTDANKSIYDAYLLNTTRSRLPSEITLPDDIPILVNDVYGSEDETSEDYLDYCQKREKQESDAGKFLLNSPKIKRSARLGLLSTMNDFKRSDVNTDENGAEAVVRDASASLEVLMLWRDETGTLRTLSDDIEISRPPRKDQVSLIAAERLRLPTVLCAKNPKAHCPDMTIINELESRTLATAPEWQNVSLLKSELLLLFDEGKTAHLNGYCLRYDPFLGLLYEKEGADGERILSVDRTVDQGDEAQLFH